MKKLFAFVTLVVCFFQANTTHAQNGKKYKLELPEQWQRKVVTDAIEEIISYTVPALRDSKHCLDCTTPYTVKYQTTASEFGTDKTGKTFYVFKGALTVYDSTGKGVNRVVLVNPEADETVFYDITDNGKQLIASAISTTKQENLDIPGLRKYFNHLNQGIEPYGEESFLKAGKEKVLEMRENIRKLAKQRGRNI